MKASIALLALGFACSAGGEIASLGTDETITLGPGESAAIPGTEFTVLFEGVPSDSRCPSGAVCVWAGDGGVALQVWSGTASRSDTLHTTVEPRALEWQGVRLALESLEPYPEEGVPIDPADYRVTLLAMLP
jgi:hypothetical protein